MMNKTLPKGWGKALMAAACVACSGQAAYAVDGISLAGTGVKAAGMGGVSIAFPQDATVAADNPAGMALIGNRIDLGMQVLEPLTDFQYGSASNTLHTGRVYAIPDGGVNWQVDPKVTFGVSIFGVGVGTHYGRAALPVAGAGEAKSSLQTVITAPTVTYEFAHGNYVGLSLAAAMERFSANGVIVPDAGGGLLALPSHGVSTAFGYGLRLGYIGELTPRLTLGASFASMIRMGKLSGYSNDLLAAGGGRIDIGEQYGAGLAYKVTPALTLAADWLHMEFSNTIIGSADAFGWKNQDFFRGGLSWRESERWTLRAGFSIGNHPIDSPVVARNLLSPMPVSSSISCGATYEMRNGNEISAAFDYGFPVTVSGSGASSGFVDRTKTEVIGVSLGHRF